MDGFGRAYARKLSSKSLASWSKEAMVPGFKPLYHARAGPRRVVGNALHIRASEVPNSAIWARKAATWSAGSAAPSYASSEGRWKCGGIAWSCISGMNGDPRCPSAPSSPFDLRTSCCTSSSL